MYALRISNTLFHLKGNLVLRSATVLAVSSVQKHLGMGSTGMAVVEKGYKD